MLYEVITEGEVNSPTLDGLVNLVATVTVTDGDGDVVSQDSVTSGGLQLSFTDTDPSLSRNNFV